MARCLGSSLLGLAIILSACTSAKVEYEPVASIPNSIFDTLSSDSIQFRIPRSQILISFTEKSYNKAVVDAVATTPGSYVELPFNSGLYYQLSEVTSAQGSLSKDAFFSYASSHEVSAFPAPSCAIATISLFKTTDKTPVSFSVTAVPTEFALPANAGESATALSPLYSANMENDIISTTRLNVTYIDNTKIVSKIGSTVTDNISSTLKSVASVVTAVAPLLLGAPAPPPLGGGASATNNMFPVGMATITVADNALVDPVPIPSSGSIVMNSVCGASTTNSSTGNTLTQASSDINAAIALYTAWPKAKKH